MIDKLEKISKALDKLFFFGVVMVAMIVAFAACLSDFEQGNWISCIVLAFLTAQIPVSYFKDWRHKI